MGTARRQSSPWACWYAGHVHGRNQSNEVRTVTSRVSAITSQRNRITCANRAMRRRQRKCTSPAARQSARR
jgi:hypothetical protein